VLDLASMEENQSLFAIPPINDGDEPLLAFLPGHWLLVHHCAAPLDVHFKDNAGRDVTLYKPDKNIDDTLECEVIAVGARCGKPRRMPKKDRKKRGYPAALNNPLKKGDRVLVPEIDEDTKRTPWDKDEYYVDESAVIAICHE